MKIKIKDKVYPFDGYLNTINSAQRLAEECYEQGRADAINEVEEKLNNTGAEIIFNLPVEEILGEDIDLDDFAMLVQDAVQVYRKMVLGVLKQLKEQKNE